LKKRQLLQKQECEMLRSEYGDIAIREILSEMALEEMADTIQDEMDAINAKQMILEALPVLPPDLRPLVPLDGGVLRRAIEMICTAGRSIAIIV
jgi:DNA-directed RNA polymerase beta' subunit